MKSARVPMSSKPSIPPTIPPTSGAVLLPCAEEPVVLAPLVMLTGGVGEDEIGEEEAVDGEEGMLPEDDGLVDADEDVRSVTSGTP